MSLSAGGELLLTEERGTVVPIRRGRAGASGSS
jgi:hypothetical protein